MSKEEQRDTKVFVKGQLVPLKDLEKQYPQISLSGTRGNIKVVDILIDAQKPLNRREIAKSAGMTEGYTRDILKRLIKKGYAIEFRLGGRALYYLLTEKGLKLAKEVTT
jgi:predicted transcriptional regulator